jgi:feruloyl-CoA synthase
MNAPKFRPFEFGITRAVREDRDGCIYLSAENALEAYPERMTDRLVQWASQRPDQTWMARRGTDGQWVRISYSQAWAKAQAIGQYLLRLNRLQPDEPRFWQAAPCDGHHHARSRVCE